MIKIKDIEYEPVNENNKTVLIKINGKLHEFDKCVECYGFGRDEVSCENCYFQNSINTEDLAQNNEELEVLDILMCEEDDGEIELFHEEEFGYDYGDISDTATIGIHDGSIQWMGLIIFLHYIYTQGGYYYHRF